MKKVVWALGSIMMMVVGGCATVPPLPSDGARTIAQAGDFDGLTSEGGSSKGVKLKLAGRMVNVEEKDKNVVILAEWLPYPSDPYLEPKEQKGASHRFFSVRYPGPIPDYDEWPQSGFLVLGKFEGIRTMDDKQMPSIVATCLHVWDRALAETAPAPWEDGGSQIDAMQHTHCVGIRPGF